MILETKLTLPQPKAGALLRTGLIKLIKNNLDKKLIMITADAGYGKTTLLAQLVKAAQLPAIYYNMDKGDSDLPVFFEYLAQGLEKMQPGIAGRSQLLLKQGSETGKSVELLMGTLINELLEKRKGEIFIILDDYHHLADNSLVHSALDFFIDRMPDIVHVMIASRNDKRLCSSAKWVAKQDSFALNKENLAFTGEELRDLLSKAYNQIASEDDLNILLEQTEGWITGIQMILTQSLGQNHGRTIRETLATYMKTNPGGEDLFGYFANEILLNETGRVKDFLIGSSILITITADACDTVLEVNDSEQIIRSLEKRHLFISALGNGEYRYHRLFKDYLQKQIGREKARLLNIKAAGYYQGKGDVKSAIDHFLAAGEYRPAVKAILESISEIMLKTQFTLLNGWMQQLPDEVLLDNPAVAYYRGRIYQAQNRAKEAEEQYALAEETARKRIPTARGKKEQHLSKIRAASLSGIGELRFINGQHRDALAALNKAQQLCPRSCKSERRNNLNTMGLIWQAMGNLTRAKCFFTRAVAMENLYDDKMFYNKSNLAFLYFKQGEMKISFKLYDNLIKRSVKEYYLYLGVIYANAANAALVMGQYDWAEKCLDKGMELCRGYDDTLSQAVLYNSRGSLYLYREEWEAAASHLEKAAAEFKKTSWKNVEIKARLLLFRLYRYQRDSRQAGQCLADIERLAENVDAIQRLDMQIELAFYGLWRRDWSQAEKSLKAAEKQALNNGYNYEVFLAKLGLACAYWGMGRKKAADEVLSKAISLSRRKGYDGALSLELRHNPELAEMAASTSPKNGYLGRIKCQVPGPDQVDAGNAQLKVQMFGTLRFFIAPGKEIPLKWPFRKVASLCAYLLLHRTRLCGRQELMEKIWHTGNLEKSEKNLYPAVCHLKDILSREFSQFQWPGRPNSSLIIHREKSYGISQGIDIWIDVEEFKKQWQRAKVAESEGNVDSGIDMYQCCLDLYQDSFLSNLDENWCSELREDCEIIYLDCLKKVGRHRLDNHEYELAIRLYKKYIEKELYMCEIHEELHHEYWKALKAARRMKDIVRDFNDLKKISLRDFSRDITAETEFIYKSLMIN